jgi:hypothetical protein
MSQLRVGGGARLFENRWRNYLWHYRRLERFISHLDNGKIVCKGKKVKEGQE